MKTRTITIAKKDIFFDVDAVTHVFARATETGNLRRADAMESDTGDTFAAALLTRFTDQRAGELGEHISRFLATPGSAVSEASAALGTATSYTFSLHVEDAFQDEQMNPLATAMESYMAHGATADWYTSVGDAQANAYQQMLPADLIRIKECLINRKFPTRV